MCNESILLSQILTNNNVYYKTNLKASDFLDPKNKQVFQTIVKVLEDGKEANIKTLFTYNRSLDPKYLTEVKDCYSSAANYKHFEELVKEKATLNHLSKLPAIITDLCKTMKSQEVLEEVEKMLVDITARTSQEKVYKLSELVPKQIDLIEERYHAKGKLPGLSTGFPTLDDMTGGFQKQRLWYVCARPSVGKTAFMGDLILHVGMKLNEPVGVFSAESSKEELLNRFLSSTGKIDNMRISRGALKPSDFHNLTEAAGKLYESNIFINDTPNIQLQRLKAHARRLVATKKVKVIFIDYIGLINNKSAMIRREQQAETSMELKQLGRELDCCFVVLSQLNREVDGKSRPPILSDIRETGQIEQDADIVIFLHHDKYTRDDENNDQTGRALEGDIKASYLIVAKARDGKTGVIPVKFIGKYTSFREVYEGEK